MIKETKNVLLVDEIVCPICKEEADNSVNPKPLVEQIMRVYYVENKELPIGYELKSIHKHPIPIEYREKEVKVKR